MKRISRTQFIVGSLIAIIVIIAVLASGSEGGAWWPPTHLNDTTPAGGRALGLVMERMGYATQAQNRPLSRMPADARVWFLLDSQTTFSDREADDLLAWVKKGGILFWVPPDNESNFFGDSNSHPGVDHLQKKLGAGRSGMPSFDASQLPKMRPLNFDAVADYREGIKSASSSGTTITFNSSRDEIASARSRLEIAGPPGGSLVRLDEGKGHIFVFPDAWMLCNYGLSKPDNAMLVANLVRVHLTNAGGGKAYFDERQHNDDLAPPMPDDWPARLRQKPVVFAVWQLLVVGLGALALVSRRLGLAVPLPTTAPVTRASGFARAMGGLLLKATRPKAAAQIIGESFRARLARRVGLSPRESDDVLAARASEISGIDRDVLSRALIASRAPATDENSALRDAQQMERILEQLG
ncbi:hypothetical protein IAD21_03142 [Abditibacteriota bacterium]|nr:hypothetical protein IAD21_03142 [Abditibacteriota bacterium]